MSPDGEGEDAESPMPNPSQISQTVRRRGAISAEPITEEDVATYVKKVGGKICQNERRFSFCQQTLTNFLCFVVKLL